MDGRVRPPLNARITVRTANVLHLYILPSVPLRRTTKTNDGVCLRSVWFSKTRFLVYTSPRIQNSEITTTTIVRLLQNADIAEYPPPQLSNDDSPSALVYQYTVEVFAGNGQNKIGDEIAKTCLIRNVCCPGAVFSSRDENVRRRSSTKRRNARRRNESKIIITFGGSGYWWPVPFP